MQIIININKFIISFIKREIKNIKFKKKKKKKKKKKIYIYIDTNYNFQ